MTDLAALARIAALTEDRALARLREVQEEEQRLRAELDEIEALRCASVQDAERAHARRISGAEAQWQGWLVQRRMALNQELILLQIKKAERQDRAREMHARANVSRSLAEAQAQEILGRRRTAEEAALAQLVLLRASG
ncbi:hypothetical protein ACOXXX_11345 [Thalassococcus sp. BH17M4-6]|uniref:hypothetical protein n=1 Tax=Thalassococcus sp. BH17M4-6 TaxID=3413148 RepID=UPI003BD85E9C